MLLEGGSMKKEWLVKTLASGIVVLFIGTGVVSAFNVNLAEKSNTTIIIKKLVSSWYSRNPIYYPYFNVKNSNIIDGVEDDIIEFNAESNESIYIIKVSNPNEMRLEHLSWNVSQNAIGKKWSSGAFDASCQVYDESVYNGLVPLMLTGDYDWNTEFNQLQYLHLQFDNLINYTYDHRIKKEFDNESIFSAEFDYPFVSSIIPPGTWYLVFSSVIYDLEQTDVSTEQTIRIIFSGNCSELNISTAEGGKIHVFLLEDYTANVIISRSNVLELMFNGKKGFHVENTLFYWYTAFPMMRGFWKLKWITPSGIKTFHLLVVRGRLFYDENSTDGSIWGMGKSGDYQIIADYLDYSRTILGCWGAIPALYPIFVGLDINLP